jgi:ATP-dependent RNA helicase DDX21
LVATDVASRGLDIPNVDLIVQCEPPKDAETYIHRSGRTARAGKAGTVVTFYAKKHIAQLNRIESIAGITFTKIGAPQPEDIIRASSKFILEGLKKVGDDALPLFEDTAALLVKAFGEKKALLLTLAYISGNLNKIKKRSLLSGTEDYVTYQLETTSDFRSVSYVWGILRRLLEPTDAEQIRQMRCYKNYKGAAFDVPEKLIPRFEEAYEREKERARYMSYTIKRAQELPDLKDLEPLPTFDRRNNHYDYPSYSRNDHHSNSRHHSAHHRNRSHSRSRSRSRSRSPPRYSHRNEGERGRPNDSNEIFMWGLKTEDDVKELLVDNKIGWKRVKVLMDDRGESKLVSFVTVDDNQVADTLKLNGTRVKGRQIRVNLASDKSKR